MDETLERKIGLKLDGRLSRAEEAAVDAEIARDPEAQKVERTLLAVRAALRAERLPAMPLDLNRKIHERLAVEREQELLRGRVLRPVRWFAVAAALVFTAMLATVTLGVDGSRIHAAPESRTIEDELRAPAKVDPGSLVPFLERWFFGSASGSGSASGGGPARGPR